MNKKYIILSVIAALVIGGGAFYGGMVYARSSAPVAPTASAFAAARAGRTGGAGARAGGALSGQILSKDATSVTVEASDGSSKIVFYGDSTRIGLTTDGTSDDLTTGSNVTIVGTTNTDGSVTASMIQVRPAGSTGGPGGGQAPSGTTTTTGTTAKPTTPTGAPNTQQ